MEHEEEPVTTEEEICFTISAVFAVVCLSGLIIDGIVWIAKHSSNYDLWHYLSRPTPKPDIELASMDFTVLNMTETHLISSNWDLAIRIPYYLPRNYICLQGDLQASIIYKNITLATSSPQKYNNLRYGTPQLLKISAIVSDEDIGGLIGKDIMEGIKEKKEVQFGSKFFLTDCRENATAMMRYVCDEVTLRFEPGSEMKATLFGNHPTCINV